MRRTKLERIGSDYLSVGKRVAALAAVLSLGLGGAALGAQQQVPPLPNPLRWHPDYGLYTSQDGDTLVWPPGTYTIGSDRIDGNELGRCFALGTAADFGGLPPGPRHPRTDLTIVADGVTLVVTDPRFRVFELHECHGFKIQGLTVTYDPLPYNQSRIDEVGATDFVVTLDPGYLGFEDTRFVYGENQPNGKRNFGVPFDELTTLNEPDLGANAIHIKMQPVELGGGRYRLTPIDADVQYLCGLEPGDKFAYLMRSDAEGGIFRFNRCDPTSRPPVTVENCTGLASGGGFVQLIASPSVNGSPIAAEIRDCTVTTDHDDRLVSTNSDGIRSSSSRKGPLVENCTLERMADDGINFTTKPRTFLRYPVPGIFDIIELDEGVPVLPDDRLQAFDPDTGLTINDLFWISQVLVQGSDPEGPVWVKLNMPFYGLEENDTLIWILDASNPDAVVRDSDILDHRGHGAIVMAPGMTFEDNVVDGSSAAGITAANIYTHNFGNEGPVPYDITIRGNVVRDCGYATDPDLQSFWKHQGGSGIYVAAWKGASAGPTDFPSAQDVLVEGNTIENWDTNGIYAVSFKDSSIGPVTGNYNAFSGSYPLGSRAIVIAAPAEDSAVLGADARMADGLEFAVTVEYYVSQTVVVDVPSILVEAPTKELEDLRP